jgi:CubicO group peptidase (beta-lactamase class C family)
MPLKIRLAFVLGFLAICTSCSPDAQPVDLPAFLADLFGGPAEGLSNSWPTSSPEDQGMYSRMVAEAFAYGRDSGGDLNSMLVIRHGVLVAEGYYYPSYPGYAQPLYSATKSVLSALIGIAIGEGAIRGVDQPVMEFFPDYVPEYLDEHKQRITIYHLLTMTSGLDWRELEPFTGDSSERMQSTANWALYVLDLPMAYEPGIMFNYSTGNSQLLSAILQKATGRTALEYAREKLFRPLGIRDFSWMEDPVGVTFGGSGLYLTPRDMAKIGYLYLRNGVWEGRQIVPADWVAMSTAAHFLCRYGQMAGWGYGYQWWIVSGMPYDTYDARGHLGQHILVVPALDLVVVIASREETGSLPIYLMQRFLIPAVQSQGPLIQDPDDAAFLAFVLEDISRP